MKLDEMLTDELNKNRALSKAEGDMESQDKIIQRLQDNGATWRKKKQDEYVETCEELDQANQKIQQMAIDASLRRDVAQDERERLSREECYIERSFQRELLMKTARFA